MKSKRIFGCLATLALATVITTPGLAQQGGFRAGIAAPQHGFHGRHAPVVPAAPAANGTFRGIPSLAVPPPQVIAPFPTVPLVPNFPTVIVPNQVLIPGQTVFPAPVVHPAPIHVPGHAFNPGGFGPQAPRFSPALGMPRADVLQRLGRPSVTVITSTGETLYFPGGVTVIIQNGRVAGPR